MTRSEKDAEVMRDIRDRLLAFLEQHETEEHGGEPCITSSFSALAYLCHAAGIRPDVISMEFLATMIAEYDNGCPQSEHNGHGGPGGDRIPNDN